jgi:hypothetical protein
MANAPSPNWFDNEQLPQQFMDHSGSQQRQLMAML